MPHVQAAARVGEHGQEIIFLAAGVFRRWEAARLVPECLSLRFDGGRFVSFLHDWASEYPRCPTAVNSIARGLTMLKLNFYGGLGLVSLSGCLWFLAVTPFDLSALAWFAAVPMLLAVDRAPTFKQALVLGWWAGVVATGGGFFWLVDVMQRFAAFPWIAAAPVFLLFCASRALIFLLFTAIVCGIRRRRRVPMTLLAPLGMVCSELLVPQLFPCGQWISQAWNPHVIQIAELTGPLGVTALLMAINGAIYDLAVDGRAARKAALAAAALLAVALLFGAVRMRQIDDIVARAPNLKIGLVQPNFGYTVEGEIPREEAIRQLTALQAESRALPRGRAQPLVWRGGAHSGNR